MNKQIGFFFIIVLMMGCAPHPKSKHSSSFPSSHSSSAPLTPAQSASVALVEQGREAALSGRYDQAADIFQEAISVDPSNGVAYYELAVVRSRSGDYGDAWGFLEKAESLLGHNPQWQDSLNALRQELSQKKP